MAERMGFLVERKRSERMDFFWAKREELLWNRIRIGGFMCEEDIDDFSATTRRSINACGTEHVDVTLRS